jgi:hypothetical protein
VTYAEWYASQRAEEEANPEDLIPMVMATCPAPGTEWEGDVRFPIDEPDSWVTRRGE